MSGGFLIKSTQADRMPFWALLQGNLGLDIGRRDGGVRERVSQMQIISSDVT